MTGNYKNNAIHITVYDMSGAPINPKTLDDLESYAEMVAKQYGLTVNVTNT